MREVEERERHNKDEQLRFLREAAEDGITLLIYVSTLDHSPLDSAAGLAWAVVVAEARQIMVRGDALILPSFPDLIVPLDVVFALKDIGAQHKRSLVVVDSPQQHSAAAAMANDPEVRALFKVPASQPLVQLHPSHQSLVPANRRRAFKVIRGGQA